MEGLRVSCTYRASKDGHCGEKEGLYKWQKSQPDFKYEKTSD
jgi:hypothetical protein